MRRLVSSRAAQEADRAAVDEFGYRPELLMEEASIRLQDRLESLEASGAWEKGPVVYLAGPGNNGGDAWAMARHAWLGGRRDLLVLAVSAPASDLCRYQADLARRVGVPSALLGEGGATPQALEALRGASVWVEGLWGVGPAASLRAGASALVAELEALRAEVQVPVAALDVPAGLWSGWCDPQPVLSARWTLSAGAPKDFCFHPEARDRVGILHEVPLSYPRPPASSADLLEASDLASLLPAVPAAAHKGTRGHVAVVGGAPGMVGAPLLAARSAAAAGAGLVSLGMDGPLVPVAAPAVPAFQVRDADTLIALAGRFDAWVVGPGWGRDPSRRALLTSLWATDLPLVLDADGLFFWKGLDLPARKAATVLTPHPGEFARLGAEGANPVEAAGALARDRGVTVVLKGAVTWIVAPDGRRAVWDGANPALATGGSGDCLAGVVGALLARGLGAFEAARAAVVLHGLAGRQLAEQEGWFTADRLPEALARLGLQESPGAAIV